METIGEIIRKFFESPWFFPVFGIVVIIGFIKTWWRAEVEFKKSPLSMSKQLRSEFFEDFAAAMAAQKRYNLIINPSGTSPMRLEHTDGTLLGHFHCTYEANDEQGRPIPLYKMKKWFTPCTWETIVCESQNTSLIQDFFFTCKTNPSMVYDWQTLEQIGELTFQTQPWSAHLSGQDLSAEIKISNKGYYGEVGVLSDDNRCLGLLHEKPRPRKIIDVLKSVKYSLILSGDLKPEQVPVVIAALLMQIQDRKANDDSDPG
jgi:hypothetical protein